jgi:twitching motility protein PilT
MSVSENLEFKDILIKAAEGRISDLHFSPGNPVKARVAGELMDWPETIVGENMIEKNIVSCLNPAQQTEFVKQKSIVFSHDFATDLRFRVHLFVEEEKTSATLRYIPKDIRTVSELELPEIISLFSKIERGLVIVSGTSGAGKSTTISAIVEEINRTQNKSIIFLKKPIEHIFTPKKCLIEQREILVDTPSFSQGTEDLLNADVDVAIIDSVFDKYTASNILELAEKAVVILEMSSQDILDTIADFLSNFDLANKQEKRQIFSRNLIAIVNQILVGRQGGGVIPVVEILLNSGPVSATIAEDRMSRIPDIIVMSGHEGMISRERALAELVKNGVVLIDEAVKYVKDKENFKEMILK